MTKTNYDISVQFRRDMMEAYKKVGARGMTAAQAYALTCKQPAPRYYVTRKQAYQVIAKMLKGDFSEGKKMRDNRRKLYASLFDTTIRLMKKRGFAKKKLYYIMQYAVLEPAPEFFCNWRTFQKIFQCVQNGRFIKSPKWYDDEGVVKDFEPQYKVDFSNIGYDRQKWKSHEDDTDKKKRVSRVSTESPENTERVGERC